MRKQKVLWLSHLIPYPPKGGVLQRSFNLLKELSAYHDVYLVAFNQSGFLKSSFVDSDDPLGESVAALSKYCKAIEVVDIPSEGSRFGKHLLAFTSLFSVYPYTVRWLYSKQYADVVRRVESEIHPDIVHYDTISLSYYSRDLKTAQTVLDHHNIESEMMFDRARKEPNLLKKAYFYQEGYKLARFEQKHCRQHTLNITCSDDDAVLLKQLFGVDEATTIENGVDTDYFQPAGLPNTQNSMVFAGGLSWYPNLDAMLFFRKEIWPRVKGAIPDATMSLVGRNPPASLTPDDGFTITGFVDDVRPYLEKASCYVCPIRQGGGTKLKILDAMAMECAIVAHPFACIGIDVIPETHVLFAETPEQFVSQISRVMSDPELRLRLGKNARALMESQYSFKSVGKKLAEEMDRISQLKPEEQVGDKSMAGASPNQLRQ